MLGLRSPGFAFGILCLEGSVISFISPFSGGSPSPVQPICAQRWPKTLFISFIVHEQSRIYIGLVGPISTTYRRKADKCIYGSNNIVHHVYCIVQFN